MKTQTAQLPILQLRAAIVPGSANPEKRTVDVTFTTGHRDLRGYWDKYYEELSLEKNHVRMDFIQSGSAPVLDAHMGYSANYVHGVVQSAELISGKEGRATVRFLKEGVDPETDKLFARVLDGIVPSVSVGYRVYKYEEVNPNRKADEIRILRATDWEPKEISFVPIGFDPKAKTRSEEKTYNVTIEVRSMDHEVNGGTPPANPTPEQIRAAAPAPAPAAPVADPVQMRNEGALAERKRVADIFSAVESMKLDRSFAVELINRGVSIDEARAAIIAKKAETDPVISGQQSRVSVQADETDKRRDGMATALLIRANPGMQKDIKPEVVSAVREYRGMTLVDMAREALEAIGEKTRGLDAMTLVGRAFTQSTSDFPVILEATINRVLLAAYAQAGDKWRLFATVGSVPDFKANTRLRMGSFGRLDKLTELSEYKNKSIPDAEKETIQAETYGNIINISRKAIINDDLNAFSRLPQMFGRAAALSIETDVFSLLTMNSGNGPVMADGKNLFHADHGNIGTGSALTVDGIDADRVLMASQKDPSGNEYLDIRPSVLLVALQNGGKARILNQSQYDPDAANKLQLPNKVAGLFSQVVDSPRVSGTLRYLIADPNLVPTFEVAFLNGQQEPFMEMQEGFDVDGVKWKVRLDYGFDAIDFRGIVKNAGTA